MIKQWTANFSILKTPFALKTNEKYYFKWDCLNISLI